MFNVSDITTIDIESINNCNAKCPLCLRGTGMNTNDSLDWSRVIANTPKELWTSVEKINFNGTTGDNLMHHNIRQIVDWCMNNSNASITINTNGSLRDTDWWRDFGMLCKPHNHKVVFGIDGLEDTHAIYRIGTSYNKIINNAKAFIHGGGRAYWQFIIFDHNAHQVEQAQQLANELGFEKFFVLYQDRFADNAAVPVQRFDKNLKQIKAEVVVKETSNDLIRRLSESNRDINCRSKQIGWISIYADGTVWPCCWLMGWHRANHQKPAAVINYHFQKILKLDLDQISLYNNTLDEILNSDLWQKRYPNSFDSKPNPVCIQQCSGKNDKHTQSHS